MIEVEPETIEIEESVVLPATDLVVVEQILQKKEEVEGLELFHNSASLLEASLSNSIDLPDLLPKTGA